MISVAEISQKMLETAKSDESLQEWAERHREWLESVGYEVTATGFRAREKSNG
jgi:hypothetical protein